VKVYLVEGQVNSPGRVFAIFADEENATAFIRAAGLETECDVVPRTLFYGQPSFAGYNE
jgi:hypothetical protein